MCVFEGEVGFGYVVLFDVVVVEVVDGFWGVDFGFVFVGDVGGLGVGEDVEVVVGGVVVCVVFCVDGGVEDDEVFGEIWGV